MNVALFDYGVGNLLSVSRALEHCGAEVVLTSVRHNRLQRNRGMEYRLNRGNVRIGGRHFVGEVEGSD